jgi:hypothetical protein
MIGPRHGTRAILFASILGLSASAVIVSLLVLSGSSCMTSTQTGVGSLAATCLISASTVATHLERQD